MAQEEPRLNVEIDPDFEPQKRPRSCTWPLPRPESGGDKPGGGDADVIPEEEDDEAGDTDKTNGGVQPVEEAAADRAPSPARLPAVPAVSSGLRKTSARRNAWGNSSYADLITQAIDSSADKRLTLAQIYDWMVRSVPYFKDKGDSNSSAGWKNSIRHNLSLHSRFVKVQNEGTGKSSWWTVNGEGGKAPRRRAVSMDNSKYIKGARGRATKKKASLEAEGLSKWTGSPASRSSDELDAWTDFRSRTNSNASTLSGRLSPILANLEPDEIDDADSPLSPMLYSSPGSASPSATGTGAPDDLNDGLMDDLLDNISLTAAQHPPPGEEDSDDGSLFAKLRQSPMQTIQENRPSTFSYRLPGLDPRANVMLTRSDPLMSQASTAVALQNARRNAAKDARDAKPPGTAAIVQDQDLDYMFNGSLDMDAIVRNELMDAECLDLSFDAAPAPNFPKRTWVPG